MLEKERFIKIIEQIRLLFVKEDAFNDALDEYDPDSYHCFLPSHKMFDEVAAPLLVDAIGLDSNNEDDMELFYWWLYDTEFGTKQALVTETLSDGTEKEYNLKDAAAFWDYVANLVGSRK